MRSALHPILRRPVQADNDTSRIGLREAEIFELKLRETRRRPQGGLVARARSATQDRTVSAEKERFDTSRSSIKSSVRRERREGEIPMETVQPSAQAFQNR